MASRFEYFAVSVELCGDEVLEMIISESGPPPVEPTDVLATFSFGSPVVGPPPPIVGVDDSILPVDDGAGRSAF